MEPGVVILQHFSEFPATPQAVAPSSRWLRFAHPCECLSIDHPAQVRPILERLRQATSQGLYAAGYLAYEAAPGLDPAFDTHPARKHDSDLPLGWFGLYESVQALDKPPAPEAPEYQISPWQTDLPREDYERIIERIRRYIVAGDTYQVNFTQPLTADFSGDPWALFLDLQRAQRGSHAAFIQAEDWAIASASPELFFAQSGDSLLARPMKGTAPRGLTNPEDETLANALAHCPKNRAENVMIVDLLRNDLGRVARPGSVHVNRLCHVERYETVLQMTSDIVAQTAADPADTFAALFPCGSITGAPKIHTMEIIRELETAPRGVYTGAIGWMGPGRQAVFNVAIRTIQLAHQPNTPAEKYKARFGVGGGITYDSTPHGEYEECLAKSSLLLERRPAFDLLETLRWEPRDGVFLLDRHLARLADTAHYFRYPCDEALIREKLAALTGDLPPVPHRLRLLLAEDGCVEIQAFELPSASQPQPRRVALAAEPINVQSPFVRHKTTHRAVYEHALGTRPDCEDVILWNQRDEVTESCLANVVIQLDGHRWTPPRSCGLLAGTFRAQLLADGAIAERVITPDDLRRADRLWLINSVRGWTPAVLT